MQATAHPAIPGVSRFTPATEKLPRDKAAALYGPALLEEREGADLDAFARPGVWRRARVGEGGVRGPPGAAIAHRFVDLEYQRLVGPHPREPVPALPRIVGDRIGLADSVLVMALVDHQRVRRDALRVADRQRMALDRLVDRPPHLDDRETALQQLLRLRSHHVAHPLRPRPFGVIVMNTADDVADLAGLALFAASG